MADIKLSELLVREQRNGNIVVMDEEGLCRCKLSEFVKQPLEGQLYDINRLESVILSFVDKDTHWVNDYALVQLVRYYYDKANGNV